MIQNPAIVNRKADFFLQNESIRIYSRFESIRIANRNALLDGLPDTHWPDVKSTEGRTQLVYKFIHA